MDQQKTLQFLHDLSEQAFTEARGGDPSLANRLAGNTATQFYYTNVHCIPTMTGETFARNYPQYLKAADDLREAYEKDEQAEQRMTALESKLDLLLQHVQQLTEAQAAKPEPEPEKPKRKGKEAADETDAGETE